MTYHSVPWALKYSLLSYLAWALTWDINYSCYIDPSNVVHGHLPESQDTMVIRIWLYTCQKFIHSRYGQILLYIVIVGLKLFVKALSLSLLYSTEIFATDGKVAFLNVSN